jgi:hypothetical protein
MKLEKFTALKAENERLRSQLDSTGYPLGEIDGLMRDNERILADLESQRLAAVKYESECENLRTYNAKLRAALSRYGLHEKGCGAFDHHAQCTCGFDAVLAQEGGEILGGNAANA